MKYLAAVLCVVISSCGYHVSGKADLIPTSVKTIGIPAFGNLTTNRYKLTDFVPQAIADELITRTRYKVVDADRADAVLAGAIIGFTFNPTVFDPTTSRAAVAEVHLAFQLTLTERSTGKVLYSSKKLDASASYQISSDPAQYFDESDAALQRASKQVASQIVTSILENF